MFYTSDTILNIILKPLWRQQFGRLIFMDLMNVLYLPSAPLIAKSTPCNIITLNYSYFYYPRCVFSSGLVSLHLRI